MDPAELSRRAIAITGRTEHSWKAPLARLLGVSSRTIERIMETGQAHPMLTAALDGLEWRLGLKLEPDSYLVRSRTP